MGAKTAKSTQPQPPSQPKFATAAQTLWKAYKEQTPHRLKFIDAFLVFIMLSGIMQFLYVILVTDYPFNAFLAGCAVYQHALTTARRSRA
jgi:oligosaccharyltransferase complex subunit epsilon